MSVVTFETLREIQRKEKKSEQLSELKDEFYKAAKEYFERAAGNSDSSELRNAQNIFDDIIEITPVAGIFIVSFGNSAVKTDYQIIKPAINQFVS